MTTNKLYPNAAYSQPVLAYRFKHTRLNIIRSLHVRLCASLYVPRYINSDLKKKKEKKKKGERCKAGTEGGFRAKLWGGLWSWDYKGDQV